MKFLLKTVSLAAASLLAVGSLHAGTSSSITGNWSDSGTWSAGLPVDGASVGIVNNATVTFQTGDSYTSGAWPNGLTIGADFDQWSTWTGGGPGTLNVTGGNLTSQWTGIGWGAGTGTLNISGGAVALQDTLALGWAGAAGSSINVSGGSLTLSGVGANVGHGVQASLNVSGTGDVNVNGGLNVQNTSTVGISGGTFDIGNTGSLNVTSGTVTVNGGAVTSGSGQDFIGNGSGTSGILNISSGSFSKSGNVLFVGWGDSTGVVNQSGGSVTLNHSETLWLGNGGIGTGTYNLSGGNFTANGLVRFGVFGSGTGIFNQSGGTASLHSVTEWGALGNYNLQGGTLKALADLSFSGAISGLNLNITGSAGNATVDTNGFNITAWNDSTFNNAAATLTKTGTGNLTIAGGGAGGQLAINNGALAIQNGTLETRSSIVVGNGGTATGSISGGTLKTGYLAASNLIVGLSGGTGNVTQTAGTVDIGSSANVALGWSGTGTYNMNGGTFSAANITYVGLFGGGVGTFNLNGGTFNANDLAISAGGATSGVLNIGAGTLNVTGALSVESGGIINVNNGGVLNKAPTIYSGGLLNINNGGVMNLTSGTLSTVNTDVTIASGGTLKLGGGAISLGGGAQYIANSGTYDVNGQTVAAGSYEASYFAGSNAKLTNSSASAATIIGTGNKNTVWVASSGAIIETVGDLNIGSILTDGGTNNGFTKTGAGTLTLSNAGNGLGNGAVTVSTGTLILSGGLTASAVNVGTNGAIGGDGTLVGSLNLAAGADFVFSPTETLTVNTGTVSFGGLSIANIVGLNSSVALGTYTLIDGTATFDFTNVSDFGIGNQVSIGGGKFAYFESGSLDVHVVPEPSTWVLLAIGLTVMVTLRRRRLA